MARFRISKRWRRIILFRWIFSKKKSETVDDDIVPDPLLQNGTAVPSVEGSSTTGLCSRCATIPWARLLEVHDRGPVLVLQDVREPKEVLLRSDCRVCRMLGSIRRFEEDNYLKWVVTEDQTRFVGKLTFAQEAPASDHDADLASAYLGIARNPAEDPNIARASNPRVDFELFKSWVESCDSHEGCAPDDSTELERLKVIDCQTRVVQAAPERCRFVALSYLWGPLQESVHQPLPAGQPPTIEDAITVTLRLGFQYLWIDRYCIDQKSALDKHLQIRQMGQIYASAQLTIIAAAGTDPTYGLPGVSQPRKDNEAKTAKIGPVTLVDLQTPAASLLQQSMWAKRGWTFQEGILSKRRLVFTDRATIYICMKDYRHDLFPGFASGLNYELLALAEFVSCARLPREISTSAGSYRFKEALRYLTAYSRRNLRIPGDALNAIVGTLNYISNDKQEPIYHLWGVPLALYPIENDRFDTVFRDRSDTVFADRLGTILRVDWGGTDGASSKEDLFEFALNWIHPKPCRRRRGFPSWSPLGWEGPIEFPARYMDILINKEFDVRIRRLDDAEDSRYLRHELKGGREIQYEGKDAISTKLEILSASVATVHVHFAEQDVVVKIQDGTVLGSDFEIYWDEPFENGAAVSEADNTMREREATWLVWQIGCKTDRKKRFHYMVLRMRDNGAYERVGLIIAWQGDPISCERIGSFVVA